MGDLAILVPMLGRPHRVRPLLDSILATCDARVVFCCTPGDSAPDAVEEVGGEVIYVPKERVGDYARKINAGYRHTTEPLLFLAADDLLFHPDWFESACKHLAEGIGVVGTNDLGNERVMAGEHATHCLVTRAYADLGTIDEPGKLLHEGYPHEYVDDELVGTAKKRGAWAFAPDSLVEHLHPNWHPEVPVDDLYAAQRHRMRQGRHIYRRRQRLWT